MVTAGPGRSWLIVGHGSVGSFLARRLSEAGHGVLIYDPAPRIRVQAGRVLSALSPADGPVDFVVSCVPPAAADSVPALIGPMVEAGTVLLDWTTVLPERKQQLERAAECQVIDVALLDSLDGGTGHPELAVSGPTAADHVSVLEGLGFRVTAAGQSCGDAAMVKLVRSVFMKALEAMVVELAVVTAGWDRQDIVRRSLQSSLGEQFVLFSDLLIATDQIHARRRANELAQAVDLLGSLGAPVAIATAAVPVLGRLASLWDQPDAPAAGAGNEILISYLAGALRQGG